MRSLATERLYAKRIGGHDFGRGGGEYKFSKIRRAREAAQAARPEMPILDFGIGEPDAMADPLVVDALRTASGAWANRGYADTGIPEFRRAAAAYMDGVFGVAGLDPDSEILPTIGSKSALAMLPACFVDPDDGNGASVTLMTTPGYPVLGRHAAYYGSEVVDLPLTQDRAFLPELDALAPDQLDRARILYLNYPNNPTGAIASRDFFARVVSFALDHQLVVVHDAAYAALTFGDEPPLSFLSVPGGRDVAIELHSLSKGFNMTGWRIGWACGRRDLVRALEHVKSSTDSGQFKAIQHAAIVALEHPEITRRTARKYERRLTRLAEALRSLGWADLAAPRAGFYLYVPAPRGVEGGPAFPSAESCADWLIREKSVSTVPWDDAGPFLRLSATFVAENEDAERNVIDEACRRLDGVRFAW